MSLDPCIRFGPDAMSWTDCATTREYLIHGLIASSGYYIGTVGFLLVWSVFGTANSGTYVCFQLFYRAWFPDVQLLKWRNILLFTLFFLELSLIVNSPTGDALGNYSFFPLSTLFRKRVPYQHTLLLHRLYMSLSIAMSRVMPVLFPASSDSLHAAELAMDAVKPIIDQLAFLATVADREGEAFDDTSTYFIPHLPHCSFTNAVCGA
jgi:hypothetical protein